MKKIFLIVTCIAGALACHDDGAGNAPSPPKGVTPVAISVSSNAFAPGGSIAVSNTCDGPGQSPQVSWTEMPSAVKTVALVLDDPDAPKGTFTHWTLWNVSRDARQIGAGGNGGFYGGIVGTNDFGDVGYGGPCPPKGALHHYHLKVYGLDTTLNLRAQDKRSTVDRAMAGHVVAQGELVGTFQH